LAPSTHVSCDFRRRIRGLADEYTVSSFGSNPVPQVPGVVQASHIAQQASAPRAREKAKPQEADRPKRFEVRDEVKLSDPIAAQAIDAKPDAAEEWKHKRQNEGGGKLDIKA
jgi:hypothetical protein